MSRVETQRARIKTLGEGENLQQTYGTGLIVIEPAPLLCIEVTALAIALPLLPMFVFMLDTDNYMANWLMKKTSCLKYGVS